MKTLDALLKEKRIEGYSEEVYGVVKKNWDAVAKPLDGMGRFEHFVAQIGAIQEQTYPKLEPMAVVVFAADNGIVAQNISQSDQSITAICAENIANGITSVCVMAKRHGIHVQVVDVGVNAEVCASKIRGEKIRMGSRDFHIEPAMTGKEARKAMEVGYNIAYEYKEKGYGVLGVGEIGIGNTTTSSAVAAALLSCDAREVTGRGAGLSDQGLVHKIDIINEALERYELKGADPMKILCHVGGYDLAGMVGLYIGAAQSHIPVVLDGMISLVAANLADAMVKGTRNYLIPSHKSKEVAVTKLAENLELAPVIDASMALGEGTGAVLMMSLLQTAYEVYRCGCPFDGVGIEQYQRF